MMMMMMMDDGDDGDGDDLFDPFLNLILKIK